MPAQLLKGSEVAKTISLKLRQEVTTETARLGRAPELALVQIGAFEDAIMYAKAIRKVMTDVGIRLMHAVLEHGQPEDRVSAEIRRIAGLRDVTGMMILSPGPQHLEHATLIALVPVDRDVEGAKVSLGESGVYPPTALSIVELAAAAGPIEGKHAVVVGRSRIVGLPAAKLLLDRNATVTICHSKTPDLEAHVRRADIVVAAVGKAGLVRGTWIKPGAVVVDAGEPQGDVEFLEAQENAAFITPVPGGVGPLTTYMLVKNLLSLSKQRSK